MWLFSSEYRSKVIEKESYYAEPRTILVVSHVLLLRILDLYLAGQFNLFTHQVNRSVATICLERHYRWLRFLCHFQLHVSR